MEGSSFRLYHELLLMAKIFSTLGYAVLPEVEERIGIETSCRLADGTLPEPAGTLGETTPAGDGEECDVVIVGSGAGGAAAAAEARRGRPRRDRARGGRPLQPRQLPARATSTRSRRSTATPA